MKSKFNKLLLSTVFAGLSFGCFTPSLAQERRERNPEAKSEEQSRPVPKRNLPKVAEEELPAAPAPKEADAEEAKAEPKLKFEKASRVHLESDKGEGLYFYCSFTGMKPKMHPAARAEVVRGAIGDYGPLENVLGKACKACLEGLYSPFNQNPSCKLEGCTVRGYATVEEDGELVKRFMKELPELALVIDDKTDVSCPKKWEYRVYDDSEVAVGKPVKKGESIAAFIPNASSQDGKQNDGSYHYESGGSYEYNSSGEFKARKFTYDSQRGTRVQEAYRPPMPVFPPPFSGGYGNGRYYSQPKGAPQQGQSRGRVEIAPLPPQEGRPGEKRGVAPKGKPQPSEEEGPRLKPQAPQPESEDRRPI